MTYGSNSQIYIMAFTSNSDIDMTNGNKYEIQIKAYGSYSEI
jgi:hypothetical protein